MSQKHEGAQNSFIQKRHGIISDSSLKFTNLIILCLIMVSYTQDANANGGVMGAAGSKYEDFHFSPIWGEKSFRQVLNSDGTIQGSMSGEISPVSEKLIRTITGELPLSMFAFNVYGVVSLENGSYFARGNVVTAMAWQWGRLLADPVSFEKWNQKRVAMGLRSMDENNPDFDFLGVMKRGKLILPVERNKLQIEKKRDQHWDSWDAIPGANHDAYNQDNCNPNSLLFIQDITLDGYSELFFFDGSFPGPDVWDNGYSLLTLHINDGITGRSLLAVVLKETNGALDDNHFFAYDEEDFSVTDKPGYQRFTKLYFADFDKNDKLDILVWHREYRPETWDNPTLMLSQERFEWYEEGGAGFDLKPIEKDLARRWLSERNLTWRKGFPDKSICPDDEHEPFTLLPDPVLHE